MTDPLKKYEYYRNENGVLYCGDCLEIMPHIPKVDLVLTDPPYGISWQSNWRADTFDVLHNDNGFYPDWIKKTHTKILYMFTRWDVLQKWIEAVESFSVLKIKNVLVWDKLSHGAGDLNSWAPTYEMIIYATEKPIKLKGKRPQNILKFWRVDAGATGKSSGKMLKHPTQKPDSLFVEIIKHHDKGTTLDPFIGSGTTAVACQNLKRNFIGIEISETYCAIARKRLKQKPLL